ncbi:thiamine biosynthesis protein ApbE [Methylobacterium hispanicum]
MQAAYEARIAALGAEIERDRETLAARTDLERRLSAALERQAELERRQSVLGRLPGLAPPPAGEERPAPDAFELRGEGEPRAGRRAERAAVERPASAALAETLGRVGWRAVARSEAEIRLRPGSALTLNGLLQGYAADRVMGALGACGIAHAFVDTGEFGARGAHADGAPWRLGLAGPRRGDPLAAVIAPFTGFAATSGDDATAFSADRRDHHIFDPATGTSPPALSAVTVTAPSGLLADALSTAAFVLGEAAGAALVARYPGCEARFTPKVA